MTVKIIITGASRGIGRSIAQQMSSIAHQRLHKRTEPFHMLLTATKQDQLEHVQKLCTNDQCSISLISGDITEESTMNQIDQFVTDEWKGEIDVLIHNAGIIDPICKISSLQDDPSTSESMMKAFSRNMQVNFLSVVQLTSKLLPHLRKARGNVFFVSSGAATRAIDGWSAYCCSKSALLRFAEGLALEELANIKVLSVRPGVVDTDMQKDIRERGENKMKDYDFFKGLHQDQKLLDPELVSRRICPLALDIPSEWNGELVNQDDEKVIQHANQFYNTK